MTYRPSDDNTLGVDLDNGMLYAAFLHADKGKVKLVRLFQTAIDDENVNPLYMEVEKSTPFSKEYLVASGLQASQTLVRRMRLKLTRDKDIDEVFAFQAEPLLPYTIENGILDKLVVEKHDGATLLTLLAAKKEFVQAHLQRLEDLQISPEVVSCDPIALAAFASFFTSSDLPIFVIHIGQVQSLCVLVKQGKLLASHGSEIGVKALQEAYFKDKPSAKIEDFEKIDFSNPSLSELPHLSKALAKIIQELGWKAIASAKETKLKEEPGLLVTGAGASLAHIPEKIREMISYPLLSIEPKEFFEASQKELQTHAIAIGLALAVQPKINVGVNFRQNEYAYPTPWKRFKKPLLIYAALSLLLAFSFYLFGESYLHHSRDKLKEKYLSMLAMIQKPYDEFELSYEAKHPNERGIGDSIIQVQDLSQEDLARRLDFLEREIRSIPDTFPLQPNVPRVSDVLAWLSTHPKVVCEGDAPDCAPLTIENLSYSLVKRPEQSKKTEKYQAKIDLEFSTVSPRIAREFHDALIEPNEMIDPKGEIKWSANRGRYRTSFFLKDKTYYPTPLKD